MTFPDDRVEAILMIDGTLIAGTMGVNRFSGQFDRGLPIGPLATTRMAGPEELMVQEDTLLELLQSADDVEVTDDGTGMFLNGEGLLLVELERAGTDDTLPSS